LPNDIARPKSWKFESFNYRMSTLLLIPTAFERDRLQIDSLQLEPSLAIELCGLGPVNAGIQAMRTMHQHQPRRVLLAGIAGSLKKSAELGRAYAFATVALHGIGAWRDEQLLSPQQLGWREGLDFSGKNFLEQADASEQANAGEQSELSLQTTTACDTLDQLLTVCYCESSIQKATGRQAGFPRAAVEDMEAYSVALACRAYGVPLLVIRGISNLAGDADKSRWQFDMAFAAAQRAIGAALQSEWNRA
jgi:futalosine hydrolase